MPATALVFHLIVTDRASLATVLIDSVDAIPSQALYGLFADAVLYQTPSFMGFFSRTLPSLRFWQKFGKVLE